MKIWYTPYLYRNSVACQFLWLCSVI